MGTKVNGIIEDKTEMAMMAKYQQMEAIIKNCENAAKTYLSVYWIVKQFDGHLETEVTDFFVSILSHFYFCVLKVAKEYNIINDIILLTEISAKMEEVINLKKSVMIKKREMMSIERVVRETNKYILNQK